MMLQRLNLIKKNAKGSKLAKGTLMATLFAVVCSFAIAKQPMPQSDDAEQIRPVVRIEPKYPIEAAKNGIDGYVVLKFDILADGSTSNISVVRSEPEKTFDKQAVHALSKWQYTPSKRGAKDMLVQLDFALAAPAPVKKVVEQIRVMPNSEYKAQ